MVETTDGAVIDVPVRENYVVLETPQRPVAVTWSGPHGPERESFDSGVPLAQP
jgi:hypothetical protein